MYYSYTCPYCSKVFSVFSENEETASNELFEGLVKHQEEYGEDKSDQYSMKEYDPEVETNMIYNNMKSTDYLPPGGYILNEDPSEATSE